MFDVDRQIDDDGSTSRLRKCTPEVGFVLSLKVQLLMTVNYFWQ